MGGEIGGEVGGEGDKMLLPFPHLCIQPQECTVAVGLTSHNQFLQQQQQPVNNNNIQKLSLNNNNL